MSNSGLGLIVIVFASAARADWAIARAAVCCRNSRLRSICFKPIFVWPNLNTVRLIRLRGGRDMVDDEDLHRNPELLQFQASLMLESFRQRRCTWPRHFHDRHRAGRQAEVERQVVAALDSRRIHYRP